MTDAVEPGARDPLAPDAASPQAPKRKRRPLWLRLLVWMILIVVVAPVLWVLLYRFVGVPGTLLMVDRAIAGDNLTRRGVPLSQISPHMVRAVIAAEDGRFCAHHGFDLEAIQAAMQFNERAEQRGSDRRRGASTISQQTAKNVFLWPQRSWIRKGLEAYFTVLIETLWPKRRIMEAYLNVAEFGDGAFGVEAAARVHFNKPAKDLTRREAARLAAVLPSPRRWSASEPGPYVRGRTRTLMARMNAVAGEGLDDCVYPKAPAT
ncbi:MAG: monofunctional biosynthetic peptidoglycan transglycosylase [Caulobacterales bacterium]|jgi:monofunctional biosynthetic peptidoglycan transglycosylase